MYQFVDRPLESLDCGCRFLVWSMRAWVTSMGQHTCPAQALAPAFARWRMIGGLQAFHRTMLLFNRDALETFGFAPLACSRVSEHEAIILSLLMALRDNGAGTARDTLELILQEDAVGDLLDSLSKVGAALAVAGIFPSDTVAAPGSGN
ncbi:hypothetical protein ABVV53_08135 [Novosphingobium sp. RD2P27]|uniref:Uncharacterized protein n=1 Tax=Novosphingobium kalidii TaxID=3230299 RepID=A0ABV2D0Q0_9SPHN